VVRCNPKVVREFPAVWDTLASPSKGFLVRPIDHQFWWVLFLGVVFGSGFLGFRWGFVGLGGGCVLGVGVFGAVLEHLK